MSGDRQLRARGPHGQRDWPDGGRLAQGSRRQGRNGVKRHGNLWPELVSFANLLRAAQKAARGKSGLANVARFQFHLEPELFRLQDELVSRSYTPGPYRTFTI